MIRGDALRRGRIVGLLGDGVLCEGVKGVDCTTCAGPKVIPFD